MEVTLNNRQLSLVRDGETDWSLALDQGGRYRVIVPDDATASALLHALESTRRVGILPASGGLLGAMTVAENMAIALGYAANANDTPVTDWEHELQLALRLCGLPPERIQSIARAKPAQLDATECWMVGLVRNILCAPDLLVLDRVFAGLSRRQAEALLAIEAVYHDFHPFRPTLFVEIDSHALPEIPNCHSFEQQREHACPY